MLRTLSEEDVTDVLELDALLSVVEDAFHKQAAGAVERPDRPHFPVGTGLDPADPDEPLGTGLVMPAYLHGAEHYATKLVGVHPGNAARGLSTVNAQIALTDAATGLPAAYLAGTTVTNARTGCIGGLAVRELATAPVTLAVLGAGTQARWQVRAVAAATDLERVRIYSPSDSKHDCVAALDPEIDAEISAAESPEACVRGANAVVTATTSHSPVFPGEALDPGALVVGIGAYTPEMQELDATTLESAARVFADVPEEVAEIGDVAATGLDASALHPFADVLAGRAGRESETERLVVESVGSAVLDAAASEHLLTVAREREVGTVVEV